MEVVLYGGPMDGLLLQTPALFESIKIPLFAEVMQSPQDCRPIAVLEYLHYKSGNQYVYDDIFERVNNWPR